MMGLEPDHFANQMAAMSAAPPSDSSSSEDEEHNIYSATSDVKKEESTEKGTETAKVHKEDISQMFGQSSDVNSVNRVPPSNDEPTLPGAVGDPNPDEPAPPVNTGPKSAIVQPVGGAEGAPSPGGRARRRTSISDGVSKVAGAVRNVSKLKAVVRIVGMAKRMKEKRPDEVPEMGAAAGNKPELGEKGNNQRNQMKQLGSEKVSERRRAQ